MACGIQRKETSLCRLILMQIGQDVLMTKRVQVEVISTKKTD